MSDYIVHRGDFIEINSSTIVKVSSFCYINELLEKVITEKVLNITDFLISIVDSVKNLQKAFQKLIKKNLLTLIKIL